MSANTPARTPMAKGTAFLGVFRFLKQFPDGQAKLQKILAALSPASTHALGKKVIAVTDYPYPVFVEFLLGFDQLAGKGDHSSCRDLGKFTATLDAQTIYSVYKKTFRPEDLIRDGGVIWKSYYPGCGRMKADDANPNHTVIRIHDFPTMHPAHCRLMEGWMTQMMVEAGSSTLEPMLEVKCPSRGDPYHEFVGAWRR